MAAQVSLGRSGSHPARRHAVDVVLQSEAPEYGLGRIYPKTVVSHGRVAFLLLTIAKNQGITEGLDVALIDPGKPGQNGTAESFKGKPRDECLAMKCFRNRIEAKTSSKPGRGTTPSSARIPA